MDIKSAKKLSDLDYDFSKIDDNLNDIIANLFYENYKDELIEYDEEKLKGFLVYLSSIEKNKHIRKYMVSLEDLLLNLRKNSINKIKNAMDSYYKDQDIFDLTEWVDSIRVLDLSRRIIVSSYIIYKYMPDKYKEELNSLYYNIYNNTDPESLKEYKYIELSIPKNFKESLNTLYKIYSKYYQYSTYLYSLINLYDKSPKYIKKDIDDSYKYTKILLFGNLYDKYPYKKSFFDKLFQNKYKVYIMNKYI